MKGCDFTESTLSEMRLKKAAMEKTDLTRGGAVSHQPCRHGPDGLHPGPDRAVGDLPGAEGRRHQRRPGRGGGPDSGHPGGAVGGCICPAAGMADPRAMDRISHPRSHTKHQGPPKRRALCCSDCFLLANHVPAPGKQPVREGCQVLPALPCFQGLGSCRISGPARSGCCSRSDLRRQ